MCVESRWSYEGLGEGLLLREVVEAMQQAIHGKPTPYMRTLRRASKDMPPQNIFNQEQYKQSVHNAKLG